MWLKTPRKASFFFTCIWPPQRYWTLELAVGEGICRRRPNCKVIQNSANIAPFLFIPEKGPQLSGKYAKIAFGIQHQSRFSTDPFRPLSTWECNLPTKRNQAPSVSRPLGLRRSCHPPFHNHPLTNYPIHLEVKSTFMWPDPARFCPSPSWLLFHIHGIDAIQRAGESTERSIPLLSFAGWDIAFRYHRDSIGLIEGFILGMDAWPGCGVFHFT